MYTGSFAVMLRLSVVLPELIFEMSINYADALSPYENKGEVGMPEVCFDQSSLSIKLEIYQIFRRYYRDFPVGSVGLRLTGRVCEGTLSGRTCRGKLRDTTLDWEDSLPEPDYSIAQSFAREKNADIVIHGRVDDVMLRILTNLGISPSDIREFTDMIVPTSVHPIQELVKSKKTRKRISEQSLDNSPVKELLREENNEKVGKC
uniref:IMS_C domain-containing protein n=1 Tax=Heterorhabditis bacteriophora TaxID=37862 RepID=A0A1I7WY94_HETBA